LDKNELGESHFFAVESNGCIGLSSRKICKRYASISEEPVWIAINKIYQRISITMQSIRGKQIDDTILKYSLDDPPPLPYTNGEITPIPPPRHTGRMDARFGYTT
jgi:hypothetical protein